MRSAFEGRALRAAHVRERQRDRGRGAGEPIDIPVAELAAAARALKRDTGLNLLPLLAQVTAEHADAGGRFQL